MPLREDLLQPIPGDNPSGKNLRYDRVYDQIKEARTEEDDTLPAGAWERTAKRADYRLVLKLAGETLATKSKDLQIAAWLGEAHLKQEGVALLPPLLKLFLDLQTTFWDTLYPEIDEGDVGLRAVPLQWAANRYAALANNFSLTKSGIDFLTYKSARALGSEADAAGNQTRLDARAEAIKRGQLMAEEVDAAIAASPKSFYVTLEDTLQQARDLLEDLALFCEERYGDDGPSFAKLRDSLEQLHNFANVQLSNKLKLEPDVVATPEPEPDAAPEPAGRVAAAAPAPVVAATPPPPSAPAPAAVSQPSRGAISGAPKSWDEAVTTVHACASFMATERSGSAVPYLLHTAIRWGELRREAPSPPTSLKVAPTSAQRQRLQTAFEQERWSDLLEAAMTMAAEPCCRAWLDLHRYIWAATQGEGYQIFEGMVTRSVKDLLVDFPDLPTWTLEDETPAASPETQQWVLEELSAGGERASSSSYSDFAAEEPSADADSSPSFATPPALPAFAPVPLPLPDHSASLNGAAPSDGGGDLFETAAALASDGELLRAVDMLARNAATQSTGRLRFRRRLEMAQLCVAGGNQTVAMPVLRDLLTEIQDRRLETWEDGDMVARPMALMLQCVTDPSDREDLFARLCRIDPSTALALIS